MKSKFLVLCSVLSVIGIVSAMNEPLGDVDKPCNQLPHVIFQPAPDVDNEPVRQKSTSPIQVNVSPDQALEYGFDGLDPSVESCAKLVKMLYNEDNPIIARASGGANNKGLFIVTLNDVTLNDSKKVFVKILPQLTPRSNERQRRLYEEPLGAGNFANTPIKKNGGRISPVGVLTEFVVHSPCRTQMVEISEVAPGFTLTEILKNTSNDTQALTAFSEAGRLFADLHRGGESKLNEAKLNNKPVLLRTKLSHNDAHPGNVMFHNETDRIKCIDLERAVFTYDNPRTPFFDIMTFIFMPLFAWKWIIREADFVKKFTECLKVFLQSYIQIYSEDGGLDVREYLTQLMDLWLDTALSISAPPVTVERVTTAIDPYKELNKFFKNPIYRELELGLSIFHSTMINSLWDTFIIVMKKYPTQALEPLRQRLRYVKRNMLCGIRSCELSAEEGGYDIVDPVAVFQSMFTVLPPVLTPVEIAQELSTGQPKAETKKCCTVM